ncbi:MAG: hypothetical protein AAFV69_00410 [Pseudomonadota bacterium]
MTQFSSLTHEAIENIAANAEPLFDIDALFDRLIAERDYPFSPEEDREIGARETEAEQAWLERREGPQSDIDCLIEEAA